MSFRIGVDIGGTFTDCMVVDGDGGRQASKALTTHGSLWEGVLEALAVNAEQRGLSRAELLAGAEAFVHGSTVATNAVLTRNGSPTGLITTRGHEDAIIIGKVFAKRAGLSEREIVHSSRLRKPEPIVPRQLIHGVSERVDVAGEELVALDEDEVTATIEVLLEEGVEAIAVSLLWSFANPAHELRIKQLLAERAPDVFCSFSHEIAPVVGEYERTATTALNAYVGPKVAGYLGELERRLREEGLSRPLLIMQSSGGLTSVEDASQRPILMLDSGPTGGILGCEYLGRLYEAPNLICTDVGGTSFDVGLVLGGKAGLDPEPVISQYATRMPKVAVHSVGAGGGSIAWLDAGGLLRVGPQSAGSMPGPACYGRGGEDPTVTDADLALGYLSPDSFLGGRMELHRDLALAALERLGSELSLEPEEVALGIYRITNAQMADLIARSTIEQGHDPRDSVLVAYGGAGPTHAVHYGQDVGAQATLVLPDSTVFSAAGMLTCSMSHAEQLSHAWGTPLDEDGTAALAARIEELERRLMAQFEREGIGAGEVRFERKLGLRYKSQVHTLEVELAPGAIDGAAIVKLLADFEARYAELYGRGAVITGMPVEGELHRVVGRATTSPLEFFSEPSGGADASHAIKSERPIYVDPEGFREVPVYDGDALRPGHRIVGPCVIERMGDSVHVPPGFEAEVDGYRTMWLRATASKPAAKQVTEGAAR